MIATIRYTNISAERKIVYKTLSELNVTIIKSKEPKYDFRNQRIMLQVKDCDELNKILLSLNNNTSCGVSLVKIRHTFKDIFKKGKGNGRRDKQNFYYG